MSISVSLSSPGATKVRSYPYIGIIKEQHQVGPEPRIVLFTAKGCGVVLLDPQGVADGCGSYHTIWGDECFEPYNGEVKLSNG